jgi:lipoprotein-anchoring transpeptidase ErfK/SrfK
MKVVWAILIVLTAFIFLPTTVLADRADCPPSAAEPADPQAIAAGPCGLVDSSQIAAKASTQATYHTVQPAETLTKIARIYSASVEALLLANPHIVNPDLIYAGDQLRIPTPAETQGLRSQAEQRRSAEQRRVVQSTPHNGQRWVDVDLQTQTVRAYEGDVLVNTFLASTGVARHPTVTGQFHIWIKLKSDDMKGPGYDLKNVPYVMYFYKDYSLHGTYWHHNFGTPMSHGCVNLRTEDAAWLFDWASVGTLVNVH